MASHSKVANTATEGVSKLLVKAFVGDSQSKAFSGVLLAIIGYLIYIKNKQMATDNLRLKDLPRSKVSPVLRRKAARDASTRSSCSASGPS